MEWWKNINSERRVSIMGEYTLKDRIIMKLWFIFKWFTLSYYQYVFVKPFSITKLFCRLTGHNAGIVYYNSLGYEPDYHCKNCDDEIN